MKLVFVTQYAENYGAHNWDGNGECPQHWKNKGGACYVVNNVNNDDRAQQVEDISAAVMPLIEYRNPASSEHVIGVSVEEDDAKVCDPWDALIELSLQDGKWVATRVSLNDEYGYMRQDIASKNESWECLPNGERTNYKCVYIMRDGTELVNG